MKKENSLIAKIFTSLILCICATDILAQGFDEKYEAYIGDYNSDGYEDIYIRQKPQIVLLHGDIATPIVLPAPIEHFVLQQNSITGEFSVQSISNIDLLQWQLSSAELVLGDFDIDGVADLLIKGISDDISGVFDQLIYAESLGLPTVVTEIDEEFAMFFRDVYNWILDGTYFDQNLVSIDMPTYSYYIVWDYAYCFTTYSYSWFAWTSCVGGSQIINGIEFELTDLGIVELLPYISDPDFLQEAAETLQTQIEDSNSISLQAHASGVISGCYWYCDAYYSSGYSYAVYDIWVPTTKVQQVFDKENYSLDARDFSEIYVDVDLKGGVYAETTEAVGVSEILERVLEKTVMGGVLENEETIGDFEDGYSDEEIASDRKEAIEWNISYIHTVEDEESSAGSCSGTYHEQRIWGVGSSVVDINEHYSRNSTNAQAQAEQSFSTLSSLPMKTLTNSQGFVNKGETGTHNFGDPWPNNEDLRGYWPIVFSNPYQGVQLIYDSSGNLVENDDENIGTYDFAKPGSSEHLRKDVTPWLEWGNNSSDSTSETQRINALWEGWKGVNRAVVPLYLSWFYRCTDYSRHPYIPKN